ncbi:TetR family transcriptional regulator [Murinocardiopsis flavida]|uniref:TetR family transcriptional regulator n=1 Tax=Murinocardiopsis flavida TaxID=645275 RepID=A0A2P8CUW1_9ACTN|nr:TetR/AcrR family transcriptional regulator [Murinocardiopsis flavida]PSK88753.1 TetR family transcriptional regulator [Murinocardiopsis flavida]
MASTSRSRRRPATRKGRPVLTREIIAAKALEMAAEQGFRAITMRALAAGLGVTVRALYNYVEDRGQVVELTVELMLDAWNPPPLDPDTWEDSVAGYARSLRTLYRRWPRALLVSIDEDAPPASIHPNRLVNVDRFLALLRAVGLSTPAALEVHRHLSLLALSFALMVDHPADRAATADRTATATAAAAAERTDTDDRAAATDRPLVPEAWLDAHADLDIPTLREAARLPSPTPDEQFDTLIAAVTDQIRARRETAPNP